MTSPVAPGQLRGRVAFITGAAGGIGLGIARALAGEGMRVVLADIDADELEKTRGAFDGEALSVVLDITDPASWAGAKRAAEARFGQVDVLCNNAGIAPSSGPLARMDLELFERFLRTNITGAFNGVSTFVPGMIERGFGHVVNTASMTGIHAMGGLGAYTTSKFGLLGFTYALREELAPQGIGVTALCPGRVDSRIAQNRGADEPSAPAMIAVSKGPVEALAVGSMVVRAIHNDEELVVTHGEYLPFVERRNAATRAAFDRLAAHPV